MSQELPDGVELAKKCGATFYSHRSSPHEPAVAFSPVAWKAFTDALADREKQAARVPCSACAGGGWVVRDPDIGTDQECFVCEGKGTAPTTEPQAGDVAQDSFTLDELADACMAAEIPDSKYDTLCIELERAARTG